MERRPICGDIVQPLLDVMESQYSKDGEEECWEAEKPGRFNNTRAWLGVQDLISSSHQMECLFIRCFGSSTLAIYTIST